MRGTTEMPLPTIPRSEAGTPPTSEQRQAENGWIPEPYLHKGADRIYNPLTDRTLHEGEPRYAELRTLVDGAGRTDELPSAVLQALREDGWLVSRGPDLDGRFLLKYVSLETHTICNQACYFCPVAYDPREPYFMPTELFDETVRQLTAFRETIDGVKLINYNEPTLDKRFLDQVRTIKEAGLPPAVLTNGTGLTPRRIDAIVEMGGLRYLSINISTLDREKYRKDRGGDHLEQVLRNMEYARHRPVAREMEIVVLGTGDEVHERDRLEMERRFKDGRFVVKSFEVMDRAGHLDVGLKPPQPHRKLRGCQVVGSRPLQHLHVTPHGKCVLCSEDYHHHYVVGDLRSSTVEEVLSGPALRRLRRWVYGIEEAPDNFICRNCIFAVTD